MITADSFTDAALAGGLSFFTGVPCSYLAPLIDRVIARDDLDYVGAAAEGEAVAIAAGAWLGGRGTVVMCQNSGLGNAVNPLTSLNRPFRIPTLMVVTWRGRPGEPDEPQHALMGAVTPGLLDVIDVPQRPFPATEADLAAGMGEAIRSMEERGLPFAMVMAKGSVEGRPSRGRALPARRPPARPVDLVTGGPRPSRLRVLERVLAALPPSDAVIATTGKCGRELFTLDDREQHLYQVGSMGGASAMALGVALTTERRVVVLDGDGAALMKLGNLATIGAHRPPRFLHLVLDNGVHDSTGGQATASATVDFAAVASACGYAAAWSCDDLDGFGVALRDSASVAGPALVHMRIAPGSMERLGRPTLAPHEVARRFRRFLAGGDARPGARQDARAAAAEAALTA